MSDDLSLKVLIDVSSDALARQAEQILAGWTVHRTPDESGAPLVLLTDLPPQQRQEFGAVSARGLAVVGLGIRDEVDAQLPVDFSDRELQVVCQIAAKLAQVRGALKATSEAQHAAFQLAETDPLTGLPNRRAWDRRIAALRAAGDQPAWMALVDLDNFKAVNDRLGMSAADQVLTRTAQTLAAGLRREDLVARIGGDEFGLLVMGADARQIQDILERVQNIVRAAGEISLSIGYSRCDLGNLVATVQAAEHGLRKAKHSGGNCSFAGGT